MSASSFLSTQLVAAHRHCIRLIGSATRRAYSGQAAVQCGASSTTDSNSGLSLLIDEITECDVSSSSSGVRPRIHTDLDLVKNAKTLDILKGACKKISRPLSSQVAAAVLNQVSMLSSGNTATGKGFTTLSALDRNLMGDLGHALRSNVSADVALLSLSSFLSLGIHKGSLFDSLFVTLRRHLSSDTSGIPLSKVIHFLAAVRSHNARYSEDAFKVPEDVEALLNDLIQLKTSEVVTPSDAISLMVNVNISENWYEFLLERTKELLPLMSIGELVSLTANLAERNKRWSNILPLVAAAFTANPNPLTANQLGTLAPAVAKLEFTDARLLRRMAADVASNSITIKKWGTVSSIAVAFAKLHFSHDKAWKALTTWISNNYKDAPTNVLSMVVSACAVCDKGHLIPEAAKHLAESLKIDETPSAPIWLNTIHALAVCGALNAKLAETVLRREFVEQFLNDKELNTKVFALSRIAQIQAFADCVLRDAYRGPVVKLPELLPPGTAVNDAASLNKYGKKEAYNAECFCNILYKVAPLDSHSLGPFLSSDGFFIDAIVQIDRNRRFVKIENFDGKKSPVLALVYLGPKQLSITCDEEEEKRPLGPVALGLRLLRERGMIPVTFTGDELQGKKLLTRKIELIKAKLQAAAGNSS